MPKRYDDIETIINNQDEYKQFFESRGKNYIEYYPTIFSMPITSIFRASIVKTPHVWSSGDKYFSVSNIYYDTPKYWWIIAWFNNKPTEHHIKIGETIYIPNPLVKVLNYYFGS